MSGPESTAAERKPRSNAWQTALTTVQEVEPPFIPAGAHAMTVVIEYPPGDPLVAVKAAYLQLRRAAELSCRHGLPIIFWG